MKNSFKKLSIFMVLFCVLTTLVACGGDEDDDKTKISFFSWGNETEINIFDQLVEKFNTTNTDNIYVEFTEVPSGDYETKITTSLMGRNVPDVIVAGDGEIKPWIERG